MQAHACATLVGGAALPLSLKHTHARTRPHSCSSFFVSNIFSGILWYVLPAFLIVANDICAYLAGESLRA